MKSHMVVMNARRTSLGTTLRLYGESTHSAAFHLIHLLKWKSLVLAQRNCLLQMIFESCILNQLLLSRRILLTSLSIMAKNDLWKTVDKACIDVKEKASLNSFFCDTWTESEHSFAY